MPLLDVIITLVVVGILLALLNALVPMEAMARANRRFTDVVNGTMDITVQQAKVKPPCPKKKK